ncbi:MAG: DUF86 domain-containing protein [Salinivirgaceae bacterium]|nr:DUF86 domain-containing protein [Salinivirgaceae bacterium]
MESIFSEQRELLLNMFTNIKKSITTLYEWNKDVAVFKDLPKTVSGMKTLSADCMLIQAIGEEFKKIDKYTESKLLPLRPEIPWKQVKGMRDFIAHGYFDINIDMVEDVVKNDLKPLEQAVDFFIDYLKK